MKKKKKKLEVPFPLILTTDIWSCDWVETERHLSQNYKNQLHSSQRYTSVEDGVCTGPNLQLLG